MGPSDTSDQIKQMQIDHIRQTPTWRRVALVGEMNQTVRTLALSGLRRRYPDDSEELLRRRLADLILGPELAARAYGPLEDKHAI